MENKIGIWLNSDKSYIISLSNGIPSVRTIESNVERDYKTTGGQRSISPFRHQAGTNERHFYGRREQEFKDYYNEIIDDSREASEIYIFGPAEAKVGLAKQMRDTHGFRDKVMAVEPADNMSENQMVAKVKKFFNIK